MAEQRLSDPSSSEPTQPPPLEQVLAREPPHRRWVGDEEASLTPEEECERLRDWLQQSDQQLADANRRIAELEQDKRNGESQRGSNRNRRLEKRRRSSSRSSSSSSDEDFKHRRRRLKASSSEDTSETSEGESDSEEFCAKLKLGKVEKFSDKDPSLHWKIKPWVGAVEAQLSFIGRTSKVPVPESQKIMFAESLLDDTVLNQWLERQRKLGKHKVLRWSKMKKYLLDLYLGKDRELTTRNDLDELKQGNMSVRKYYHEFLRRSMSITDMSDADLFHNFMKGLNKKTHEAFLNHTPLTKFKHITKR